MSLSADSSLPVVGITGLENRDNPHPGVAVARALRAARGDGIRIVGLAYDPSLTGCFRNDLFDAVHLVPFPGDPAASLAQRLIEIRRRGGLDVVIPTLDSEIAHHAKLKPALAGAGISMVLPESSSLRLRSKLRLASWCRDQGLHAPRTEVVLDVDRFFGPTGWGFPCFLKGPVSDAERVRDLGEATAAWRRLAMRWGYPVLAQEPVVGDEYDVCAVATAGGTITGMITIRKVALSRLGKAVSAIVVEDPDAAEVARRVVRALRWEGPLELELMRETSSGRFHVIEINARFPAWIGIAPGAGANLPDLLLSIALREDVPKPRSACTGTLFVRTSRTTLGDVASLGRLMATGSLDHRRGDRP